MGIFSFRKDKNKVIDFSDENIAELKIKSDLLGKILIENGKGVYLEHLSRILNEAENKNEAVFRRLVISRELFGGSGALWEIYIEDFTEYHKFNKQFSEYIGLLTHMGIKNGRVKQIQKRMCKLK